MNEKLIRVINKVGTTETANYINSIEVENIELQKKVAELERELRSKESIINSLMNVIVDLEESQREYEEFEAQNAKFREALEFYADKNNWREQVCKFHSNWQAVGDMSRNGGKRARKALERGE